MSKPRLWVLFHFAACPAIALVGTVLATDFPFVPNKLFAYEVWWVQVCAMASAVVTSLITAFLLRNIKTLRRGWFVRHYACLFAVLVVNHFLWVEPIWGFHRDSSLGIIAWLFIGGDDGFVIFPNFIGFPLTVACYWWLHATRRRGLRTNNSEFDITR